jgi:DNA-binding CsgD family transcriptional regulator
VSGEAGIGKTSLVRTFCKQLQKGVTVYQGTCDALFSPRPLAPLYDILLQFRTDLWKSSADIAERALLFNSFFHELSQQQKAVLIVFEDIHWADEATLDFIKFLARRITQLKCLFVLTCRDNEIHAHQSISNLLGQLPPDSFTRIQLPALSKQAVEQLAGEKGFNGQHVYSISGGNPFYVNEILASYSPGVPDNIKDSIIAVYNRQEIATRQAWELLSILPTGLEINYVEKIDMASAAAVEKSLASGILIAKGDCICFKHELYRRTIEASLSPLLRVALNKKILDLFGEIFLRTGETERIVHHAKNANEYDLVVKYAPVVAAKAAAVGAHTEACRLYLSAIEYYQGKDKDLLIRFYELYAYECYLTNQAKEAIIYMGKSMQLWKAKNDPEKIGNCLRFLSRLWWFEGNRKNAENFAQQAIAILADQPPSRVKAMAFSNMSQLKMLSDEAAVCIQWGAQAIAMARELNDEEILSHALNNVGTVQMKNQSTEQKGYGLLQESLSIAVKNAFHEHAARAYTNMGTVGVSVREYTAAGKALEEGINYCEERDLDSWTAYMLSWKARLCLETGLWATAYTIADNLVKNTRQPAVVTISALVVMATIKMRRGDVDALDFLLEAKVKAFEAGEMQRILPSLVALMEYEWITGKIIIEQENLSRAIGMMAQLNNIFEYNGFAFWLRKARGQQLPVAALYPGYDTQNTATIKRAAAVWEKLGCPYEQALILSEGTDDDKRKAISMVQALGAHTVYEKMKLEMRISGIKSIPRGIRKTTQLNPAQLTSRELDVLRLLKEGWQNKELAARLFISAKTVDHHISSILFKLDVNSRAKAVQEAIRLGILK